MKTIRTTKNRRNFLAALETGGNVTTACESAFLSRAAVYQWREDDPTFAAGWDAALERGLDSLEDELMRRAKDGTQRPVYQSSQLVGHIREYSDSLAMFLLKSRRRHIYGDRREIEHSGSLEMRLRAMTPEQRRTRLLELHARVVRIAEIEAQERGGGRPGRRMTVRTMVGTALSQLPTPPDERGAL